MPAASRVTVDTKAFSGMCRTLAGLSAVPYKEVVRAEVGKVLEKTLAYTRAAKRPALIARWADAQFTSQPASLYTPRTAAGLRARARAKISKNGKLRYFLFNRYPDALDTAIHNRRLQSLERKLKAIGLAKQSWLRLADQLGVAIKAPAFVRKAVPVTGRVHLGNTSVKVQESPARIQIGISNAQPTVNLPVVGGARALQAAIAGRVKGFEKNIRLRVFNDIKKIARAYPGIKVTVAT